MKHHYEDIRSRIDEDPSWFDENGVPRYGEFHPNQTADVYAKEVVLLLIKCQNCGHEFRVAMSWGVSDEMNRWPMLKYHIENKTLHYGDPPNEGCCLAGPTMNSIPMRVLEYWAYAGLHEWKSFDAYEDMDLVPEWANEG